MINSQAREGAMICMESATSVFFSIFPLQLFAFVVLAAIHVFKLEPCLSLLLSVWESILESISVQSLAVTIRWQTARKFNPSWPANPQIECKLRLLTWQDTQCLLAELKNRANIEIRRHVQSFTLTWTGRLMNNRVHLEASECIRFRRQTSELVQRVGPNKKTLLNSATGTATATRKTRTAS